MRLDLGGQPWPGHVLDERSLARVEEPVELCSHLLLRRAEVRRVALPDIYVQGRMSPVRGQQGRHRILKLQTLELDHNEVEEVDGDAFQFPQLEQLDLGFNKIHTILHFGTLLSNLTTLVLKRNRLTNLRWLRSDMRLSIQHLDISYNMIQSISDTAEIVNAYDLQTLDATGNPLEGDLTVEAFCMLGLPQLTHLNGHVITEVARARARTWCEDEDTGRAIAEYVGELHAHYAKPKPRARPARDPNAPVREEEKADADPLSYLQQSMQAVDFLVDAARGRTETRLCRNMYSTMPLHEFGSDKSNPKMMQWAKWSCEMRRLGRRIHEARAQA